MFQERGTKEFKGGNFSNWFPSWLLVWFQERPIKEVNLVGQIYKTFVANVKLATLTHFLESYWEV